MIQYLIQYRTSAQAAPKSSPGMRYVDSNNALYLCSYEHESLRNKPALQAARVQSLFLRDEAQDGITSWLPLPHQLIEPMHLEEEFFLK